MLTIIGYIMMGGTILYQGYYAYESVFLKEKYEKRKMLDKLFQAFEVGEFCKKAGKNKIYPYLLNTKTYENKTTFIFSVPKGMDPGVFTKKQYIFHQYFGEHAYLKIDKSKVILEIYKEGLTTEFAYNVNDIKSKHKLPIVCGKGLDNMLHIFDLVKHPHILIAGETGSGKSSQIRSILTTLIKMKSPKELRLLMGDLKRSEFHLFKNIKHVDVVCHSAEDLRPHLKKVKREMTKRGDKLDAAGVNSIDELKEKLPYIIVCIDEVVLLKKETDIMDILEEISSIGRSLGVFIILSMQRPDAKILDGKLKVNLTVRMGFKTADSINSKIIGTPGSENITTEGRMLLRINSRLQEIQCPWLHNDKAKKLLKPYKVIKSKPIQNDYELLRELFRDD